MDRQTPFAFTWHEGEGHLELTLQGGGVVPVAVQVSQLAELRRVTLWRDGLRVGRDSEAVAVSRATERIRCMGHPLSSPALERFLVRHLKRRGTLSSGELCRLAASAWQPVSAHDLTRIALSVVPARMARYEADRWTLLPWVRLGVTWEPQRLWRPGPDDYHLVATAFWLARRTVPTLDEEPSAAVRREVQAAFSAPDTPAYLVPTDQGLFRRYVGGRWVTYRLVPEALPVGELFSLILSGQRTMFCLRDGRVWDGLSGEGRDCTPYATKLLIEALNARPSTSGVIWGAAGLGVRETIHELKLVWSD